MLWDIRKGNESGSGSNSGYNPSRPNNEDDAFEQVLHSRKRSVLTISTDKLKGLPSQVTYPTGMVTALAYQSQKQGSKPPYSSDSSHPSDQSGFNLPLTLPDCGHVYIGFEGGLVGVVDIRKYDTVVGYSIQDHKQPILNMDISQSKANIISTGSPVNNIASMYFDLNLNLNQSQSQSQSQSQYDPAVCIANPVFTPLSCQGKLQIVL